MRRRFTFRLDKEALDDLTPHGLALFDAAVERLVPPESPQECQGLGKVVLGRVLKTRFVSGHDFRRAEADQKDEEL